MKDCQECRNCLRQIKQDLMTMFEDNAYAKTIIIKYFNTVLGK